MSQRKDSEGMNATFHLPGADFHRLEVIEMVEVSYRADLDPSVEPYVGQFVDDTLDFPEDAVQVGERFWSLYGRSKSDGLATCIGDYVSFDSACEVAAKLGGLADEVTPGPTMECHGRILKWQ